MIYDRRHICSVSPPSTSIRPVGMTKVIVIEFVTLDGVIEDPNNWAFRHGPEAVAGDKFALGEVLDTGVMLLGRKTWEMFSGIWPTRDDPFSRKMNAIPKLVATRTLASVAAWQHSTVLAGDLDTEVAKLKQERDVVVSGSASVVNVLRAHDLVDEYRLLIFPAVVGQGRRMFDGAPPVDLELVAAEPVGPTVRLTYGRLR